MNTILAAGLLLAPALCVAVIARSSGGLYLPKDLTGIAVGACIIAWSPLPISLPAVILGTARDRFEPGGSGVGRGLRMVKALSTTKSWARLPFCASLLGCVGAVVAAVVVL